jgi:hypothetical protein
VQAVMSAREGPKAAQRKLEQAGADPATRSGSFPVPATSDAAPAMPPPSPAGGGIAGFFRRLFGRGEAR